MDLRRKPSPWGSRRDRVPAVVIGGILAFVVWKSLWPTASPEWDAASRLARRIPASLPLPSLLAVLMLVLVVWRMFAGRRRGGPF